MKSFPVLRRRVSAGRGPVSQKLVADCLETLEEIGMGIKEEFEELHDDAELMLVPCVNSDDRWVDGLAGMVRSA